MSISELIEKSQHALTSVELASELDAHNTLSPYRNEFAIPTRRDVSGEKSIYENENDLDQPCTYLCGNSLGLMPKRSRQLINEELDAWSKRGVEGHWNHPYGRPWATVDELVKEPLAHLVGAKPSEVTAMNTLTSNIHAMLITFYRPTEKRFKILIEQKAFPSDHYAVSSHLHSRGIDPKKGLLTIAPRQGEHTLRTQDIIDLINRDDEIAVVMLSGVQYYTGQFFEIEKITKAGKEAGCIVGWDLAHAVGNVPLQLHDWNVDFACWCSYKYLNSGAGGIAGLFIHEKYNDDQDRPRLAGWWGNQKENRFEMRPEFQPSEGASGYQLSNPSIFTTISLLGSLDIFEKAGGIQALRQTSFKLTGYLEKLLLKELEQEFSQDLIRILTPNDPQQRGCQLSLEFPNKMMEVFDNLHTRGVIVDDRKPTVIRVAPAPLYNTFRDCFDFVHHLKAAMKDVYAK
ncbi:kynureninase [Mucor lusitanicus]